MYVCMLQVWNGHILESQHVLLDVPIAVEPFCVHNHRMPRLAVAAGFCVYIFIGVKPHFKIHLPSEKAAENEDRIWCTALGMRRISTFNKRSNVRQMCAQENTCMERTLKQRQ
jgi:Ciliary BBSome complex subunit 1